MGRNWSNSIVEIGKGCQKNDIFRFENRANAPPPSANTLAELGKKGNTGRYPAPILHSAQRNVVILTNGDRKSMDAARIAQIARRLISAGNNLAKKIGEAIVNRKLSSTAKACSLMMISGLNYKMSQNGK